MDETTIVLKTSKKLRDEAKSVAKELGVPLTTVLNGMMRQFVREKKFSVSASPAPTKEKIALWENISAEMDRDAKRKMFGNVEDLLKDLRLR
ncbi:MAG: hypothetical protein NUV53_03490 [Patescibacteria group bacterium]|nr:hypothetical protein [Patescibacteria group bacterium]